MKILALDSATEALSVALYDSENPQVSVEHFEVTPRAHATALLPTIQKLLAEQGWQLADLDGIAFSRGPGAFTGLRIGAGLVQGLAFAANLPVMPVSSLAALAWRALTQHDGQTVTVMQDARMQEVYTANFALQQGKLQPTTEEQVIAPQQVANINSNLYAGNGWFVWAEANQTTPPKVCEQWPHALDIATLGAQQLTAGQAVSAEQALPVYVRDNVARKPSAKGKK